MDKSKLQKFFLMSAYHRAYDDLVNAIMHLSATDLEVEDIRSKLFEVSCKIRELQNDK